MSMKGVLDINSVSRKYSLREKEVARLLKVFPGGVVAFDLEMTGLLPLQDRIVEIGAVKIAGDGSISSFEELVDPEREIPEDIIKIHGITNEMVRGKRKVKEALLSFLDFCNDLPLIAHNGRFDAGYLIFNIHQQKLSYSKSDVYCSLKLSRQAFKSFESFKLVDLAKNLEIIDLDSHRACDDAYCALKVYALGLLNFIDSKLSKEIKQTFLFNLNDFNKNNDFEIPDHLKVLEKKILRQHVIDIKYKGGKIKNVYRAVRPISILPMPHGTVLYGHCFLSDMYKSFALKKITEVKELNGQEIHDRLKELKKLVEGKK